MVLLNFFDCVHETIQMVVHQHNFKSGAFKEAITEKTSVIDALNIFCASPLLSSAEKQTVSAFLAKYRHIYETTPRNTKPGPATVLYIGIELDAMTEIFRADAKASGRYIAPDAIRVIKKDGSVHETHAWDTEAGKWVVTESGAGSAPLDAQHLHLKKTKETTEAPKEANADTKKNPSKQDKPDFGSGFSKNLQGAFL